MRLKSIRWRLPINFLGIVALTVLLLGIVLFVVLRAYYTSLEQSYLRGVSQALPTNILDLLKSEDPEAELLGYFENLAFLSQTHIRVIDIEGEAIIDTGSPTGYNVALGVQGDPRTLFTPGEERIVEPVIILQRELDEPGRYPLDVPPVQDEDRLRFESLETATPTEEAEELESEEVVVTAIVTAIPPPEDERTTIVNEVPVYSTTFGFSFAGEDTSSEGRSSEDLKIEIYEPTGLVATIEFTEGPAYGREILRSVAIGFTFAGVFAVVLATAAGWRISNRFNSPLIALTQSTSRISQGDYSSRAEVDREDELGILARTFNTMADRVETTVFTLRRFVSDAAHELNTPLTALRTNLELASDEEDELIQKSYVDRALAQTKRLEELASALLDLSRLESGATHEDMTQINLLSLIREESERFASKAEHEGITFSLDLRDEDIQTMGRPNQIRRAVSNLLDNAIKFTPQDGMVVVGCQLSGDWIEIWVEDTGIGIPSDEIPQLFSRFHRARNSLGYPGNGLGLVIVKTIVEGHRGWVQAESEGQGSRFTIQLPTSHSLF